MIGSAYAAVVPFVPTIIVGKRKMAATEKNETAEELAEIVAGVGASAITGATAEEK